MPTYNRATYIGETVESIRGQTYQDWELIIIDDGSDDNTADIIGSIPDERIQFYKAGRIGIGGKIKNLGIGKSAGDLIAFMDSDDLWAATKLGKQVNALHQYPEAGFSLTGGYNFRKPGEPIDFFYKQTEGVRCDDIFLSFFKSEVSGTMPSLMLRKHCIDAVGSFDEAKRFSDVDFMLKLARNFKAVILYEQLLYRRLHQTNDSSSNWEHGYREGIALIQSYRSHLPPQVARNALARLYINFGEDCLMHKENRKAINKFLFAWKNNPFSPVPFRKTGKAILQWLKNK